MNQLQKESCLRKLKKKLLYIFKRNVSVALAKINVKHIIYFYFYFAA